MRRLAGAVLVSAALTTPAAAQQVTVLGAVYVPFGLEDLDGELPPSVEVRLAVPLSERFALEPFVSAGRARWSGVEGFYGLQVRHRIVSLTNGAGRVVATYGISAYYSRYGSTPPIIGHLGVGLEQRVAHRLAFRPEVQVVTFTFLPIGARLLAGLSVRLR